MFTGPSFPPPLSVHGERVDDSRRRWTAVNRVGGTTRAALRRGHGPDGLVLSHSRLVGFVATAKLAEARSFYQRVLGLALVEEGPFALVLDANGTTVRVQIVPSVSLAPYTALGWQVEDIRATIGALAARGVIFERYEGLVQDGQGIWTSPDGSRVAWFKDADGNTLSLTERGEGQWPGSA